MTVAFLSKIELLQNNEKNKIKWKLKLDEMRCKQDKMKMRWDKKELKMMTRWDTVKRIL